MITNFLGHFLIPNWRMSYKLFELKGRDSLMIYNYI